MRQPSAVRQRTEDYERASLSTWAALARDTKGRERAEEPDPLRTAFQSDRDRIVSCRAFTRLAGKTQSFLPVRDDAGLPRDRDRLRHALEVVQVARTLARALRLNEDLVEAIALGHAVGHTPFGPAGEEALSVFADEPFRHHEQSVRVVEVLERDGTGLNLTWEVREGILHHADTMPPPSTLEGQAVRAAKRIALVAGDVVAALEVQLLSADVLPAEAVGALGPAPERWASAMIADVVNASLDRPEVVLSARLESVEATLRDLLAERVHARPAARAQGDRAIHCLRSLVVHRLERPDAARPGDPPAASALDEVAAMTDGRALAEFRRIFLPDDRATR